MSAPLTLIAPPCADPAAERAYREARTLVSQLRMEEAAPRYRMAAEAGHIGAEFELGRMALHGMGVPASLERAVAHFERAEAAGLASAADHLALLGLGDVALPCDRRMEARLHAAADVGWPPAMLAMALIHGRDPHPDAQLRCLRLLEACAGRGDVMAAQLWAERLRHGEGCVAQPEAAQTLRAQLAAHGVPGLPGFTLPCGPDAAAAEAQTASVHAPLPPAHTLSVAPPVRVVDGLLSADECRLLIAAAMPHLHPSRVTDPHSGRSDRHPLRTSHDANFDPVIETTALRLIQRRMAAAAGLPLANAERLTVLRYTPGQEYRPHRDYLPPGAIARDPGADGDAGNRLRTVCVYLSPVAAGGGTVFPELGLDVQPRPGRALVFDNLDADGQPDPRTLHAGLPVESGEKWLATLWIRERRYRAF